MGLEIVNGLWTACSGTVRGLYGPHTSKYEASAGFLPIMVVSIPLRVHKGTMGHPCRSHPGPVRVL